VFGPDRLYRSLTGLEFYSVPKFQLHGPISEGQHLRVEQEHVTEPCFLSYTGSVFRFTGTLAEIVDPVVIAVPAIVD
jgi:hypothetical protein